MGHELWPELSAAISFVDQDFFDNQDFDHPTSRIVRVHFWAVIHDRPTDWATRPTSWDRRTMPKVMPNQSTMSRRVRTPEFEQFMRAVELRVTPMLAAANLFKRLDGKPLIVAAHSKDPDAKWGRGAGQKNKGYKLHAIFGGNAMPLQWRIAPLDISEQSMGRRMLRDLKDQGYVGADKNYDANKLFDEAGKNGNQLVCPRRYGPDKGLGHQYQSPYRLRSKDLLEVPPQGSSGFGQQMMHERTQIERDFGNLCSFSGGLAGLPSWVRRYGRVRRWVWAKLMINAARLRVNERKSRDCA
jgi:hypothetical protein